SGPALGGSLGALAQLNRPASAGTSARAASRAPDGAALHIGTSPIGGGTGRKDTTRRRVAATPPAGSRHGDEIIPLAPAGGGERGADVVARAGRAHGGEGERAAEPADLRRRDDRGAVDLLPDLAWVEVDERGDRHALAQQLAREPLAHRARTPDHGGPCGRGAPGAFGRRPVRVAAR